MLNNTELMNLYKAEKSALDFPSDPFPKFKEWKEKYMEENKGLFVTTSADQAIKEADQIVEEAEKELSVKVNKKEKAPKVIKISVPKVEKKSTEITINNNDGKTKKTDLAKSIYKEMMDQNNGSHPKRGDVIKRFMSECGLSNAGASTYQYNMKKMFSQQAAA